jgi:hypothetical protein
VRKNTNQTIAIATAATLIGGCSGHMFKFGALMGEQLARTATGDQSFKSFKLWAEGRHQSLTKV